MVKVITNSQGKVYTSSGKALLAPSGGGGGGYQLRRITDDNNNEIGTAYMEFEDANGNKYDVVCLDSIYRNSYSQWCSNTSNAVTDLPIYESYYTSWWYTAKETATFNTQKILDYCSANGYTSTACTHCLSKSFTIGGTTYYGQLPNAKEIFEMCNRGVEIDALDNSSGTSLERLTGYTTALQYDNFSSTQKSAVQYWKFGHDGGINGYSKSGSSGIRTCPVLEIPK